MDYDTDQFSNYSMPVFSWDYEDIEKHEHWYRMTEAYISCCLHLLYCMADESLERDFFRAKACVSLFDHSIELFLKFAIYAATNELRVTHNLKRLYDEYCALYPEDRFKFDVDINSVVRQNDAYPYNTFAKYPVDKEGNLWPGNQHIDVIIWLRNVKIARNDFLRLKPLIIEKYNNIE
jgi:hypothetical protein